MKQRALRAALLATGLWLTGAEAAFAHPLDPALLEITEAADGTFDVLWRLPLAAPASVPLEPRFPAGCVSPAAPRAFPGELRATLRWRVDCGERGLVGRRVGVEGLREWQTDVLLRVRLASGRVVQKVLRADAPFLEIPAAPAALDVLRDYVRLGFEHILTGLDHLLFVLGLVLLVHGARRRLWTITAFKVGHSVTLSLAVLGFVAVPPQPVEALIAGTIFVLGLELTRDGAGPVGWIERAPWRMAFGFGLLHGLGFAGALSEVGLPAEEIPLALFSFNVGIELGQLLFVVLILLLEALPVRWPFAARGIPAYAIGSLGAFWVLERVASILR